MQFRVSIAIACLILVAPFAPGLRGQTTTSREPIARIGDQPIYDEDLLPSIAGKLFQLKSQEYELKSKELAKLVNERLLESAAKAKGLSTDALLEQAVYRNLPPPTPGEIEAYYLSQKDQIRRALSEVKPQMEEALTAARREQARQHYLELLHQNSNVAILLPRPRIDVTTDPSRLRGNPHAPVTIVEFSDFQCPYCRAVEPTINEVLEKYKDKVRFSYRDFPLNAIHPQAEKAAEASRCAGEQGKFWEYHDLLYANQAMLDEAGLAAHARSLGLDVNRFSTCLVSGKFKPSINGDLQAGVRSGVAGTPAFYINGIFLSGAQPLSAFEEIIRDELATAESKRSGQ